MRKIKPILSMRLFQMNVKVEIKGIIRTGKKKISFAIRLNKFESNK